MKFRDLMYNPKAKSRTKAILSKITVKRVPDESPDVSHYEQEDVFGEEGRERIAAFERGEWAMIGIYAEAEVLTPNPGGSGHVIQHIRSGGLWGIESDSDETYFTQVEDEERSNLQFELESLGFSSEDVKNAPIIHEEHV